jgi:hypothetical protein
LSSAGGWLNYVLISVSVIVQFVCVVVVVVVVVDVVLLLLLLVVVTALLVGYFALLEGYFAVTYVTFFTLSVGLYLSLCRVLSFNKSFV